MKSEIRNQVEAFMLAADQEVKSVPEVPADDTVRLRAKLILEEAFELLAGMYGETDELVYLEGKVVQFIQNEPVNVNIVEVADACADIDYVVEGCRLAFGINGKPIADEVQRNNMAKFGPGSWVREDGKLMKPKDHKNPDLGQCLREQGWKE